MSHIDFAIGFFLTISTMFMIIYFISNSISNSVADIHVNELRESSLSLEKNLFEINDDKSLISTYRELQMILKEVNNTDHNAEIILSIKPQVNKVKIYDSFLNEIASTSQQLSGETLLYFSMFFNANENKTLNIIYSGSGVNDIDYLSTDNNITVRILSDKEVNIVSQEKCSKLQSVPYQKIREMLGFNHDFRVDLEECSYGPVQPSSANVLLRNVPIIFESDGLLKPKIARLVVW